MYSLINIPEIYLLIATFVSAIGWTLSQAWIDQEHISDEDYIEDHKSRSISRAMVGVLVGIWSWKAGLIVAFVFWSFFDVSLNKMRSLDFWYFGTVADSDNYWKTKKTSYKITKIVSLIVSILLVII